MRMFVALPLPPSTREALDEFCASRREADRAAARRAGGRSDWSWTLADQWHVTLAFAAEVPPDRLGPWDEELDIVARRTLPFRARLDGAGTFPHPDAAKVLHLRVTEPDGSVERLEALSRAVRTAAQRSGVRCDGTAFVPHLTLARSRRGVSATRWLRVFDTVGLPAWPVAGMQLLQSVWPGAGQRAVHQVEGEYAFGR